MPVIDKNAAYATFINTFRCRPENQGEVVQINIDIIDQVAVGFQGFVSATVHRSEDGTRVINYLQWETADDLARMQRSAEFRGVAGRLVGLVEFDHHQCEIAHVGERRPSGSQ
jgi:hypothetical protein